MPVKLSKFDNSWYQPGSVIKQAIWYLFSMLFMKTQIPYPSSFKKHILKIFGARIGTGLVLKPNVQIKYPWHLKIGNNVWIGEGVWIDNLGEVTISNDVCLSQGAYLLTGNHDYKKESFDLIVAPISIEDGVWVGAKAIVCPGTILKSHCVVTAGSVIGKTAEPYVVYGGNPAIALRRREISTVDSAINRTN